MTARAEQSAVTVVAAFPAERRPTVEAALRAVSADPGRGRIPFEEVPGTHFARLFVVDSAPGAGPPRLVYMSDVDGAVDQHLERLVAVAGAGLDEVFEPCDGYPALPDDGRRVAFLRAHAVRPAAMYASSPGVTVEQVRTEAALRSVIEAHLDTQNLPSDPVAARAEIREFVAGTPALSWAMRPVRGFGLWWRLRAWSQVALAVLALLLLSPVILLLAPAFVIVLRLHEVRDAVDHSRPSVARRLELASFEDVYVQNAFSGTGRVKPGWFRSATIRVVLAGVAFLARHYYNRGRLAGVRTIHFFRLVSLDGDKRFIFASTYDGSLESYMDDFIDKVAWGLNAIFSNGIGYPRTRFLFFGGARQEQDFKNWLQERQLPVPVFYSAYPHLTTDNVAADAALRAGLSGRMNQSRAAAWLRLL